MQQDPYYPSRLSDKSTTRRAFSASAGSSQFPKWQVLSSFNNLQRKAGQRASWRKRTELIEERRSMRHLRPLTSALKDMQSDCGWERVYHLRKWVGPGWMWQPPNTMFLTFFLFIWTLFGISIKICTHTFRDSAASCPRTLPSLKIIVLLYISTLANAILSRLTYSSFYYKNKIIFSKYRNVALFWICFFNLYVRSKLEI